MKKQLCFFLSFAVTLVLLFVPMLSTASDYVTSTQDPRYRYAIQSDGTIHIVDVKLDDSVTRWIVPETLDGYTVSSASYYSSHNVREIVLPSSIKTLRARIYEVSPLKYIYLSEGLQTIEYRVNDTTDYIVIPSSVTFIAEKAFGWVGATPLPGHTSVPGHIVPMDGFTVYSFGNEVARAYAETDGHDYVDLNGFDRGDLDINGTVNMMDALTLYAISSGEDFGTPLERAMADSTKDGVIDTMNSLLTYRVVSG